MKINKKNKKILGIKGIRNRNIFEKAKYTVFVVLPVILTVATAYFFISAVNSVFHIKKVVMTGNEHLTDDELKNQAKLNPSENLLTVSSSRIFSRMLESPWIRSVSVRKEFPDRLHILIKETEPFALLDMKGKLFIVDDRGKMLEELKDSEIPFLPIISSNPFAEKDAFFEAIRLAAVIKATGLLSSKDHIEIIAHKSQEIVVNLDGVIVKIGAGDYQEKIARLMEIEQEIKKRNISVDYIDVRFVNKIYVKPVNEVIK